MKMSDLSKPLSRTWESVSDGWTNLMHRAENALTHFRPGKSAEDKSLPAGSPSWALLNANVFDDDEKVVVELEAPGLNAEDFDVNVVENVLIVSGEKHFEKEETKGDYRLLERAYGHFSRSIPLGYEVDADSANATYKKGVLRIELAKRPDQRRRQIKVV